MARASVPYLANFRPVSNDEVELIEVSYTLANTGVLGSPMYAGFYDAEAHHLWTLPVQHVLDAVAFRAFGAGVAQARWVSVAAALVSLWCIGWLAWRFYGLAAGIGSELLLVFWRSNLTDGATGLPLLDVARVARYDVLAVAFICLTLLASTRPSRFGGVVAGVAAGLAALSQFFGVAGLVLLAVERTHLRWRLGAAGLVLLPWLAYAAVYRFDLAGQLSVYGQRGDFLRPGFYVQNVLREPERFAALGQAPAAWLLVGLVPALGWLGWRCLRCSQRVDRLLATSLLATALLLIVLDATKTPLYAIVLVPLLCLLLGAAWSALVHRFRFVAAFAGAAVLAAIVADGLGAYAVDRAEARLVTPYAELGERLAAVVPPEGAVLGPERWWWALHDRPYVSLRSLWFQWVSHNGTTSFSDLAAAWQPRSIIVNNNIRDDIRAFPPTLQEQFWTFLATCTRAADAFDDPTYLEIQVYLVTGCQADGGPALSRPAAEAASPAG